MFADVAVAKVHSLIGQLTSRYSITFRSMRDGNRN